MTSSVTAADVLDFWFHGDPAIWCTDPWFKKNDAYDLVIRTRFGTAVQAAQDGENLERRFRHTARLIGRGTAGNRANVMANE